MARFAENTSVSVDRTKAEIERLVQNYGAVQFATGWDGPRAVIGFGLAGRTIRFILTLPDRKDRRFTHTDSNQWMRSPEQAAKAWEQGCRSCWRALLLVIKAKLEAVECGISTIEDEFLAHTVLPSGQTVGDAIRPQIAAQIESGRPARLLLPGGA